MCRFSIAAAVAAAGLLASPASAAIVVHTTAFLGAPVQFNGFEAIGSSPNATLEESGIHYPDNTDYTEGGLTVRYVGAADIAADFGAGFAGHTGDHGWYPDGGGHGYTRITLESGADFDGFQALVGSGYFAPNFLVYRLLNNGVEVAAGHLANPTSSQFMRTIGFSGGGFDEINLQAGIYVGFGSDNLDALALDDLAAGPGPQGAVPEPATWATMILGLGLAGAAIRRRRPALL